MGWEQKTMEQYIFHKNVLQLALYLFILFLKRHHDTQNFKTGLEVIQVFWQLQMLLLTKNIFCLVFLSISFFTRHAFTCYKRLQMQQHCVHSCSPSHLQQTDPPIPQMAFQCPAIRKNTSSRDVHRNNNNIIDN